MSRFFQTFPALLLLVPASALAGDKTGEDFTGTVTVSPIHLTISIVELTGELQVIDDVGVGIIGGWGQYDDNTTIWELGMKGRYYLLGDFKTGLQLGGELLYIGANSSDSGVSATASGPSIGPFVGGKWTADFGLTLELQIGAQYFAVQGRGTDGTNTATSEESGFGPLINLNVGWSF